MHSTRETNSNGAEGLEIFAPPQFQYSGNILVTQCLFASHTARLACGIPQFPKSWKLFQNGQNYKRVGQKTVGTGSLHIAPTRLNRHPFSHRNRRVDPLFTSCEYYRMMLFTTLSSATSERFGRECMSVAIFKLNSHHIRTSLFHFRLNLHSRPFTTITPCSQPHNKPALTNAVQWNLQNPVSHSDTYENSPRNFIHHCENHLYIVSLKHSSLI